MNTSVQSFEITEISILTFANEISMRGKMHKNNLSYETELSINSHQLNKVINTLQYLNPDKDVSNSFTDQTDGYGNAVYFFYGDQVENRHIELESFADLHEIKRIRA